MQSIQSFAG